MRKNHVTVYYSSERDSINFKFFLHGILVLTWIEKPERGGNKRKSKETSISRSFMNSAISTSSIPLKSPDLILWEKYLKSFKISEKVLLEWIDKNKGFVYRYLLEELREKIKDNL